MPRWTMTLLTAMHVRQVLSADSLSPVGSSRNTLTLFGQRLSSDLCGPFPPSVTNKTYALVIVDAATNYLFVEYMDSKSSIHVKNALEKFVRIHSSELQACRDAGFTVQWHTDNGGEFMSTELDDFCEELAING